MSDAVNFTTVAMPPEQVAAHIAHEDANTGKRASVEPERRVSGDSRNGWFWDASHALLEAAGADPCLRFLSNRDATSQHVTGDDTVGYAVTGDHRRAGANDPHDAHSMHGYIRDYTIVRPDQNAHVAQALDAFWQYCLTHIDMHPLLSDYWDFDDATALRAAVQPAAGFVNDAAHNDDGDHDTFFYLTALCSIRDILREAGERGWTVVHRNEWFGRVVKTEEARVREQAARPSA